METHKKPENPVRFITTTFFGGRLNRLSGQMDWPSSTLTERARVGSFTSRQQREILMKSDALGWGIRPAHFFPDRLAADQRPVPHDVTTSAPRSDSVSSTPAGAA